MTKANVINGGIEYIPRKTKEGRPVTVRVPLNSIAKEILERYKDCRAFARYREIDDDMKRDLVSMLE
jgi:hypothetical protein